MLVLLFYEYLLGLEGEKMKEEILKLRAEGLSYNAIVKALGCNKSMVCYYCGEGQQAKTRERTKELRKRPGYRQKEYHKKKRPIRIKKVAVKKEKPIVEKKLKIDHKFKAILEEEKVLPIKPVNVSQKIPVRINHKTIVYANSLEDIERIKAKYSKL